MAALDNKEFILASTSWPRFRGNRGSTGQSMLYGPRGNEIQWRMKVGSHSWEPIIGIDDSIYLALDSNELLALNFNGRQKWKKGIFMTSGEPFYGMTPPVIRQDGSLILGTTARIQCWEANGDLKWEKLIDGLPSPPNIGLHGIIYVPAWSIDWAGLYVLSPDGHSYGKDDPRLTKEWRIGRNVQVSPAAIDEKGNLYVSYRANITHPEAYTWDPPDEINEDFYYECVFFNYLGEKLGFFLPDYYVSGCLHPTSICVDHENIIYYMGGRFGQLIAFKLEDILAMNLPKDLGMRDGGRNLTYKKHFKLADSMLDHSIWTWDRLSDKDSIGKYGKLFGLNPIGHPAIGKNNIIWIRLEDRGHEPSKWLLKLDTNTIRTKNTLNHEAIELSAPVTANPIIDGNDFAYLGTLDGKVHVFNAKGVKLREIEVGHPISSLIIGPHQSLIITTNDGFLLVMK